MLNAAFTTSRRQAVQPAAAPLLQVPAPVKDLEKATATVVNNSDQAVNQGLQEADRSCRGFLCRPATVLGQRCHYILFTVLGLLYFLALGIHFGYAANQERLAEIRYTMNVASYQPASHNLSTVAPYIVKTQVENYYDVSLKYMILFPLFFWGITVYALALFLPMFAEGIIKEKIRNTSYLLQIVIWPVAYTFTLYVMGDDGYNLSILGAAPVLAAALCSYLISMIERVMYRSQSLNISENLTQPVVVLLNEWEDNIMWGTVLIAINGVVFALLAFVPIINILMAAQKENKTVVPALQALLALFLIEMIFIMVDIGATMYRLYHHGKGKSAEAAKVEVVSEWLHVLQHLTLFSIVLIIVWYGSEILLRAYLV